MADTGLKGVPKGLFEKAPTTPLVGLPAPARLPLSETMRAYVLTTEQVKEMDESTNKRMFANERTDGKIFSARFFFFSKPFGS